MSSTIMQIFSTAVFVLCTESSVFASIIVVSDESTETTPKAEPTTLLPELTDEEISKILLNSQNRNGSEIYGQTDAEQLSQISVIDVILRKRRSEDCDETHIKANEGLSRAYGPPAVFQTAQVVPEESPAVPIEVPVIPNDTPAEPVEAPVVPAETPAVPVEAPVVPAETPAVPVEDAPVVVPEEAPAKPEEAPVPGGEPPVISEQSPVKPEDSSVSVEAVELVSYEEISTGENDGGEVKSNDSPDLTPPAVGINCTNLPQDLNKDENAGEPEPAKKPSPDPPASE